MGKNTKDGKDGKDGKDNSQDSGLIYNKFFNEDSRNTLIDKNSQVLTAFLAKHGLLDQQGGGNDNIKPRLKV